MHRVPGKDDKGLEEVGNLTWVSTGYTTAWLFGLGRDIRSIAHHLLSMSSKLVVDTIGFTYDKVRLSDPSQSPPHPGRGTLPKHQQGCSPQRVEPVGGKS